MSRHVRLCTREMRGEFVAWEAPVSDPRVEGEADATNSISRPILDVVGWQNCSNVVGVMMCVRVSPELTEGSVASPVG